MTEQIKSAIETLEHSNKCMDCEDSKCLMLKHCENDYTDEEFDCAIDVSIRSLQAWEEVLNELEQRVKTFSKMCDKDPCMHYEDMEFAYMNCINIINQHLSEIEER